MPDSWHQILNDLRGALGLKGGDDSPPTLPRPEPVAVDPAPEGESLPGDGPETIPPNSGGVEEGVAPESEEQPSPPGPLQRLYSYAGLGAALLLAMGVGWYAYFGGPRPPSPDVVASFDGGQITVEQLRQAVSRLDPHAVLGDVSDYETYRALITSMVLDELVRRWAQSQQLDRDAKFADAMRHVSESSTLDEWVAEIHKSEMTAAVRESDIQAYFEANRGAFGGATLSEVRDQIREALAHQDQEQFFEAYIADLRADATIVRDYALLDVPEPGEADVRSYYDANRAQFTTPRRVVVDLIYVPPTAFGDEADAQARARAEAARAALQVGRDIAEVAAEYSQTPYSPGGIAIEAETDDPAMVEQAFALSTEGGLSPVFRTQAGYYVLRLREAQPERTQTLDEARARIAMALRAENEREWFEQNADRTLFSIHGERYTLGQFDHEVQNLPPEFQDRFAGPQGMRELAELLIDRLLVLDDAYDRLLDQQNAPLLEEARTMVLRQMMHQAEVDSQVLVSDQEIRDYFEAHKEWFASPPEARIRSIRIFLGQTEDDRARAWERAETAYKRLVPGVGGEPADFETLAREYDDSEDTRDAGLGEWVRMGDDVLQDQSAHPLHEYLLNLPVGSVSQPFEFGGSIYLVKVLERTEPEPLAFEAVQDYIRAELEAQQHAQLDSDLAARMLRDAHVAIYDEVLLGMLEADRAAPAQP